MQFAKKFLFKLGYPVLFLNKSITLVSLEQLLIFNCCNELKELDPNLNSDILVFATIVKDNKLLYVLSCEKSIITPELDISKDTNLYSSYIKLFNLYNPFTLKDVKFGQFDILMVFIFKFVENEQFPTLEFETKNSSNNTHPLKSGVNTFDPLQPVRSIVFKPLHSDISNVDTSIPKFGLPFKSNICKFVIEFNLAILTSLFCNPFNFVIIPQLYIRNIC